MEQIDWSGWRRHYEQNVTRSEPPLDAAPEIPLSFRAPLASSLARFQLGEAGEGRIAHQIDHVQLAGIDADYRAALKRFVAEEGRHARILGRMVNALGGRLLTRQWTERLFFFARRLIGIRLKLMVLLAAEVIGIGFYGLLSERLPDGALARALAAICSDEQAHLQFHLDFFRANAVTFAHRWLYWAGWWAVGTAAAAVVWLDHLGTLRAFGVPPALAAARLWTWVAIAARELARPGAPQRLGAMRFV